VGDVGKPPDVGQRDQDFGLQSSQVSEENVGPKAVVANRLQHAAVPGHRVPAGLPAKDGHLVAPLGKIGAQTG
jgi:hypothetical protein